MQRPSWTSVARGGVSTILTDDLGGLLIFQSPCLGQPHVVLIQLFNLAQ